MSIVAFSPPGCTATLISEIVKATKTIHVQAYSFTSQAIAQSLVNAFRRGLEVHIILDAGDVGAKGSQYQFLKDSGLDVTIDAAHAIAHNKLTLIDGLIVCTGSFNYTNAAEHVNAENLLVLRDPVLYGKYRTNWEQHRLHSVADPTTIKHRQPIPEIYRGERHEIEA